MTTSTPLTDLLGAWSRGDAQALESLTPLVYRELHRLAHHYLRSEPRRALQTTELVNEAFLRLLDSDISWSDRCHFYVVAARTMRRVLVDLARRAAAAKRDGAERELPLWSDDGPTIDVPSAGEAGPVDLLVLDEALVELSEADPRKGRAIELRYFAGLSVAEIAGVLEISVPTAERDLRLAKAWLGQAIRGDGP